MLNPLKWLASALRRREPKVEILCIHGKNAFHRNEIASKLFQERLKSLKAGTIVCSPTAIVPILSSLTIELPDGAKWWSTKRKLAFAMERLTVALPGVALVLDAIDVTTQLVWIDGGSLVGGYTPTGSLIFTGKISDDPFVALDRTTFIPGVDGGHSYRTNAGEYCSSWHC